MDLEKAKDVLIPALLNGAYAGMAYFLASKEVNLEAALISAGMVALSVVALELKRYFEPKSTAAKGGKKRRGFFGQR